MAIRLKASLFINGLATFSSFRIKSTKLLETKPRVFIFVSNSKFIFTMFKHFIFSGLFFFASLLSIQADSIWTVASVPNPTLIGSGYISDPDQVLPYEQRTAILSYLKAIKDSTDNEVAVVIVNSIGEAVPHDFGVELFNLWGIGVKGKDNGLLIFLVMDQRRVEFITGYGMEGVLPDALCKRIQMVAMVPRFKEGAYGKGLQDGLDWVYKIMKDPANEVYLASQAEFIEHHDDMDGIPEFAWITLGVFLVFVAWSYYVRHDNKAFGSPYALKSSGSQLKNTPIRRSWWIFWHVVLPIPFLLAIFAKPTIGVILFSLWCLSLVWVLERTVRLNRWFETIKDPDTYKQYLAFNKSRTGYVMAAIVFPVLGWYLVWWFLSKLKKIRNTPRPCSTCGALMKKLDEKSDDAKLVAGQKKEEELGSVDYDVWVCDKGHKHDVLKYESSLTSYDACKKCGFITSKVTDRTTLIAATEYSTGTGQKTHTCKHCGHVRLETYTIPKITASSSSSGGSSGGGGGSSFGGGSSGGGGSGSSW
jgi:uncharacterized protein